MDTGQEEHKQCENKTRALERIRLSIIRHWEYGKVTLLDARAENQEHLSLSQDLDQLKEWQETSSPHQFGKENRAETFGVDGGKQGPWSFGIVCSSFDTRRVRFLLPAHTLRVRFQAHGNLEVFPSSRVMIHAQNERTELILEPLARSQVSIKKENQARKKRRRARKMRRWSQASSEQEEESCRRRNEKSGRKKKAKKHHKRRSMQNASSFA